MRINQWLAQATGMSRRAADTAIAAGEVTINENLAGLGQQVTDTDMVKWRGQVVALAKLSYLALNKPTGYVCSRSAQGQSPTIYTLLPQAYHDLKSVGRLDKDSSGLLLLTNDGPLAQELTHPSHQKLKTYQLTLDRPLQPDDRRRITDGVNLDDGPSRFDLAGRGVSWTARLREGRNRQIRRTFAALGYRVVALHRTSFGKLQLGALALGAYRELTLEELQ